MKTIEKEYLKNEKKWKKIQILLKIPKKIENN